MLLGLNNADTDADAAFADKTNDAADDETAANAAKAAAAAAAAATAAAATKAADAPEERRAARLAAALLAPRAVDSILLSLLSCKEAKRLGQALRGKWADISNAYVPCAVPGGELGAQSTTTWLAAAADPRPRSPSGATPRACALAV
jgi:hypothetical protein